MTILRVVHGKLVSVFHTCIVAAMCTVTVMILTER